MGLKALWCLVEVGGARVQCSEGRSGASAWIPGALHFTLLRQLQMFGFRIRKTV